MHILVSDNKLEEAKLDCERGQMDRNVESGVFGVRDGIY